MAEPEEGGGAHVEGGRGPAGVRRSPRGEVREEEHRGEGGGGEERVGEGDEGPFLPLDHHPHRRTDSVRLLGIRGWVAGVGGGRWDPTARWWCRRRDRRGSEGEERWDHEKLGCWAKAKGRSWAGPIMNTS